MDEALGFVVAIALIGAVFGGILGYSTGSDAGATKQTAAIAADLAAQGYTLQRVETVGEGARWTVVEQ